MTKEQQLVPLLEQLPTLMQELTLWQTQMPDTKALQSTQPFAVDTLKPEQWLQWIFLPKMTVLIKEGVPLPQGFAIAPYFEESWKGRREYTPLLALLRTIDEVCA
ncbi:YqcC family protein [Vibrio sp. Isolate25]|uniref:YqcC family protein n=1 Tax=Vibrio TaxID=662 RepID=UPI001EFD433E|nr:MULTISPECIES: YqcC family protein [Vibrio]MCG9597250.1 YqcC family protein [Vibrio sp. Isolate25]MCG9677937.1 YqcC family protein [Vibrio sp. Isolate24]MCG9684305.1 YqcC family protein [Vibrio sp. Isolate23]USD31821.1 YqcC family protein [Vibrio sp. SCSIO 43186]USD44866.1 YqcC family protein [Vibrio sp. SCSIO 43145]